MRTNIKGEIPGAMGMCNMGLERQPKMLFLKINKIASDFMFFPLFFFIFHTFCLE